MKKKQAAPQRRTVAVLRCGKMMDVLDTWRYWEIVEALQWMGADRPTACDTAKALQKARPGEHREIPPGITIDITEKEAGM